MNQPRPKEFETAWYAFLNMKRAFKNLNHLEHEPKASSYGLTDRDAAFIRARVERDFNRAK